MLGYKVYYLLEINSESVLHIYLTYSSKSYIIQAFINVIILPLLIMCLEWKQPISLCKGIKYIIYRGISSRHTVCT